MYCNILKATVKIECNTIGKACFQPHLKDYYYNTYLLMNWTIASLFSPSTANISLG